jgi:hypothetical protein
MSEGIEIDTNTAVIVCAGPSLDRLSATAWNEFRKAGAIVAARGSHILNLSPGTGLRELPCREPPLEWLLVNNLSP